MSEPRFTRRNHGSGHSYLLDGLKVPGVTTVIGALDKPALVDWAAKTTARYAVDNWDRLSGISIVSRFEELVAARRQTNKEAVVRGKRIHALAERIIKGESVEDMPDELRAPVQAYADMLDAWGFEAIVLEAPCANLDYRYAGTFDAIMTSPKTGPVIVDVKTGKRAYSEVALQLAAYRHADVYLEEVEQFGPRGGKLKSLWVEKPMPTVNGALCIHVAMETEESPAKVDVLPVEATPDIFEQFLFLLEVHEGWVKRTSWNHKSDPAYAPPIGEPIYPEQTDRILEVLQ